MSLDSMRFWCCLLRAGGLAFWIYGICDACVAGSLPGCWLAGFEFGGLGFDADGLGSGIWCWFDCVA